MFSKDEAKELRLGFWDGFKAQSTKTRRSLRLKKDWMLKNTGINGVTLRFDADRKHCAVGFDISLRDKFTEALYYEKFESLRNLLESALDEEIIWDEEFITEEGRTCSRIYVKLEGVDYYQKKYWEQMWTFMIKNMILIERTFIEFKDYIENIND